MNNKGLSSVVTSLIIIILSLVAIGIIWAAISGSINRNSSQVGSLTSCLSLNMQVTGATCTSTGTIGAASTECVINLKRTDSEGAITGVKAVLFDANNKASNVIEIVKDVPSLQGAVLDIKETDITDADFGLASAKTIEVTPYFKDASTGNPQYCNKLTYAITQVDETTEEEAAV